MFINGAVSDSLYSYVDFNMYGMGIEEQCISMVLPNSTGNKGKMGNSSIEGSTHCSLPI